MALTSFLTVARPMPVPLSRVLKKGSQIFPALARAMPGPSSATVSRRRRPGGELDAQALRPGLLGVEEQVAENDVEQQRVAFQLQPRFRQVDGNFLGGGRGGDQRAQSVLRWLTFDTGRAKRRKLSIISVMNWISRTILRDFSGSPLRALP